MAGLTDNTIYGFGETLGGGGASVTEPPRNIPEVIKPEPEPEGPDSGIATPASTGGGSVSDVTSVLGISGVDFQVTNNAKLHHTDEFHCVIHQGRPVIRRGQLAKWVLLCRSAYDPYKHDIRIRMDFSWKNNTWPTENNGTRAIFAIQGKNARLASDTFGAKFAGASGNRLDIDVMTPHNCCVGNWTCYILTNSKGNRQDTQTTRASPDICILFNAWCPGDTVFLDNEDLRREYVLLDYGKMYSGSWYQIYWQSWNFAQFEEHILDCVFKALRLTYLKDGECGNAIKVVRNLTSGLNWLDNGGVLEGKWANNNAEYANGVAPWRWHGSEQIFLNWYRTGIPTRYGQCWVFAGITTTALRALGVPARCVTNFRSAHDTNNNCAIEANLKWGWNKKYRRWGYIYFTSRALGHVDSTWNYHCWNEVWMKRPDLPAGYDGWQVVDSTPQERSGWVFQCGPTSLVAVKNGDVTLQYDTAFVWAEVDADKFETIYNPYTLERIRLNKVIKDDIGRKISTKKPGLMSNWYDDREDITHLYKHPESSAQERAVVHKAMRTMGFTPSYTNRRLEVKREDVDFDLREREQVMIGQPFGIYLEMKNTSDQSRAVYVELSLHTGYYTGAVDRLVKKENFEVELKPNGAAECVIRATPQEYLNLLVDQGIFKVTALANVEETEQVFIISDCFTVEMPKITIQGHQPYQVGKPFRVECTLQNPLPNITLHDCEFTIEGPGLQKELEITLSDVPPGGKAKIETQVTPSKSGNRILIAGFTSKELNNCSGQLCLHINA